MKVLIYGGCHAGALKRIFDRYALGEHRFDTLTNYQLIAAKTPFPYERLAHYDLVVFNPILNKEDWNTVHLEDACRRIGRPFIKYPWLQWAGYWPTPRRRTWGRFAEWGLSSVLGLTGMLESASDPAAFERFYGALFEPRHFAAAMPQMMELTTEQLRKREQECAVDVSISDFILANYRRSQLFLTPDHPSNALYAHVVRELARLAGLTLDPAYGSQAIEVQEGVRTPILPGVAEAIGLEFSSSDWAHHEFLGRTHYTLREWALSSFPAGGVTLGVAKANTHIRALDNEDDSVGIVRNGRVLAVGLPDVDIPQHWAGRLLGADNAGFRRARFFRAHWDFVQPSV
ncbi:WcbI family polysaccharide biosynthesis putative acetyltransferase [Derxia lacustris]|uniref:WcbI family polysaccharide biosynthesis putative acetyltransferase n=1 Tax=Derxia lacustris TaxID=764842 RepID=UPI000A173868|nr:WcbI family polysaccharide biosynthesis putative acetyltransferase [Derxia lacustris]